MHVGMQPTMPHTKISIYLLKLFLDMNFDKITFINDKICKY